MSVLVLLDHDRGALAPAAPQAVAFARTLDAGDVIGVLVGAGGDQAASGLAGLGLAGAIHLDHAELTDYAPEAFGDALAALVRERSPRAVVATGTDRGNEVLAHVAAVLDQPFAANVTAATLGAPGAPVALTRVRWGGSLLEHAELRAATPVLSAAPHVFAADPIDDAPAPAVETVPAAIDAATAARTRIVERVTVAAGITLQTAPVVVSGGRGVGSAEGFAPLEQLAALLGGAVGCSRVVTNQGWRPHADQVGQTGKRVAPDLYIACGISGAIQHWIGMQAARHVLAINIDRDAPMVTKADTAVIGDVAEVIPALVAEIERRRG